MPKKKKQLLVTCISDTHCTFPELPGGDVLIHAGDFSFRGRHEETGPFLDYLEEQLKKYRYIVYIAGNHELTYEKQDQRALHQAKFLQKHAGKVFYLHEEACEIEGIKFYGAPHQPYFCGWAFNVHRGLLYLHWDKIPQDNLDVLITHGPPADYGDFVLTREWSTSVNDWVDHHRRVGCVELLEAVKRVKPRFHVFGHIHSAYGVYYGKEKDGLQGTTFINACSVGEDYKLINRPIQYWFGEIDTADMVEALKKV